MTGLARNTGKLSFLSLLALVWCIVCPVFSEPALQLREPVEAYLHSLSPLQRVSLLFLVNIDGCEYYRALEYDDAGNPLVPGGCLFFSYNVATSADKVIAFTQAIANYCTHHHVPRPYTAIDQEGGGVNRLRDLTSSLPSPYLVAQNLTPIEASKLYSLQGEQMAALGFDLNLAPVVEAAAAYNGDFLSRRIYGPAAEAAAFSSAAVRAYQLQQVMCAVKHFPGNSATDPHTGVSVIAAGEKELAFSLDLPFSFVLTSAPAAVLMSHAVVPSVDPDNPAVLSRKWITEILRGRFGYEGLVISDDIFMGALSSFDRKDLAVQAVRAGADVLMLSDKYFKECACALLDEAEHDASFAEILHEALQKLVLFKLRAGLLRTQEAADGTQQLVEVSLIDQRGTDDFRLKTFLDAKKRGTAFYNDRFRGGTR